MKPRLHILGCGRAASTLARLWCDQQLLVIGQICNRSLESAEAAAAFIGQGQAVAELQPMDPSDWLLLAVPESVLPDLASRLGQELPFGAALVFHLSGAELASVLGTTGRQVAAMHPVCPFSQPGLVKDHLQGAFAVGEGDQEALDALFPLFEAIGFETLRLDQSQLTARKKRMYHAATIAASNFLNTLSALSLSLTDAAGLDSDQARALLASLQRVGLSQIEALGPAAALTGPIERMDRAALSSMADAIEAGAPEQRALFDCLNLATVDLAIRKHPQRKEAYLALRKKLHDGALNGRV